MDQPHLDYMKVYHFGKKIRLGIERDGGYVIADLSGAYDCYISAGVGREESFSKAFIERYGMHEFNSFGVDSSIEAYPIEYTNNISFIKKNISGVNDSANTNLKYLTSIYKDIFLKMDIEGGEYGWISAMNDNDLNHFRQITIEVHGINNDSWGTPYTVKSGCLKRLANTHYLIHAHGNNARGATNYIPNVFELTYVRKSEFAVPPVLNRDPLPDLRVDFPNNVNRADYPLGMRPFTNV